MISRQVSDISRQEVVNTVIDIVKRFRNQASQAGDPYQAGYAALELGKVFHIVQDLVFHHGVTAKQHQVSKFIRGFHNPDYPDGIKECDKHFSCKTDSEAKKKLIQARNFTKSVLEAAVAGVDNTSLQSIFGLKTSDFGRK